MFCNGLRESHEEQVDLKGVDREVMRVLLEYTYTSQVHLTHANVQQILEAACQFQVSLTCHRLQMCAGIGRWIVVATAVGPGCQQPGALLT